MFSYTYELYFDIYVFSKKDNKETILQELCLF